MLITVATAPTIHELSSETNLNYEYPPAGILFLTGLTGFPQIFHRFCRLEDLGFWGIGGFERFMRCVCSQLAVSVFHVSVSEFAFHRYCGKEALAGCTLTQGGGPRWVGYDQHGQLLFGESIAPLPPLFAAGYLAVHTWCGSIVLIVASDGVGARGLLGSSPWVSTINTTTCCRRCLLPVSATHDYQHGRN